MNQAVLNYYSTGSRKLTPLTSPDGEPSICIVLEAVAAFMVYVMRNSGVHAPVLKIRPADNRRRFGKRQEDLGRGKKIGQKDWARERPEDSLETARQQRIRSAVPLCTDKERLVIGAVGSHRMLPRPDADSAARNARQNTPLFPLPRDVSGGRTRGLGKDWAVCVLASRPMHTSVADANQRGRCTLGSTKYAPTRLVPRPGMGAVLPAEENCMPRYRTSAARFTVPTAAAFCWVAGRNPHVDLAGP